MYGAWPRTVLILIEFNLSYQNYDNMSCSVPVGISRKVSILLRISPYGGNPSPRSFEKYLTPP